MVKRVTIFSLPEGTDQEKFWQYHTKGHAADVMKYSGSGRRRYVINRVTKVLEGKQNFFAIIETWWDTREDMDRDMETFKKTILPNGKSIFDDFASRIISDLVCEVEEYVVKGF